MIWLKENWLLSRRGFAQIPVLVAVIVGFLVIGGGYIGAKQYQNYQVKQLEKEKRSQELLMEQQRALNETKQQVEELKAQIQEKHSIVSGSSSDSGKLLQSSPSKAINASTTKALPDTKTPNYSPISTDFVNPMLIINSDSRTIEIHGSGFKNGLTVSTGDSYLELSKNYDPNPQPNVIYVIIPTGMSPGIYDIKVKNQDGGTAMLNRALTVRVGSATQNTSLSTTEIVNKLRQSVVLIRTKTGCGTGIVIDRGEILTNNHVVKDVDSANVLVNGGQTLKAMIVNRNESSDMAVLRPEGEPSLQPAALFTSNEQSLPVGSEVVALGYPLTCNQDFTLVNEEGSITARRDGFLQTSARIHCGNSGGPLVEKKTGQVIGINTKGLVYDCVNLSQIGLAIPSDLVQAWLTDVRSK